MQKIFSNPLQVIRSKAESLPILKLKYFNCQKGDLHDGQVLNYVCIQKGCKENGLICSICKNDHIGHHTIPLKFFLEKLKQHKQNSAIQSQSFQKELEQLQNLKTSFLYDLKETVQKLAQKIQKVEEYIIEKFKQHKIDLLSQIEIKMRFNDIIESAIRNDLKDQSSFERDFKIIAGSVQVKSDNKTQNAQKNNIYFNANLQKIVSDYESSYKRFCHNLDFFSVESTKNLEVLMKKQEKTTNYQFEFNQKKPAQENKSIINENYVFNEAFKGSNIAISSNKKNADCINSGNERFALIDGKVLKKGSIIKFKIQKLKNWVGIGLAVRDLIKQKKFRFQYSNLGHGSYLLSNNNFMWSHTSAAHNFQKSQFEFFAGHVIKIEVTEKQLIYTNETQIKEKRIPISLTESQWAQACFCVNLCLIGDSVTIL